MHVLASHNRSEFLATPGLIRFDYAKGRDGFEPTFLIKGSTLLLKYIVQGVRMQLVFSRMGDCLLYALRVHDDENKPCSLWSIMEREEERAALNGLVRGEICQVFLFNELAVNVAWASLPISVDGGLPEMIADAYMGPADHAGLRTDVSAFLDRVHAEERVESEYILVDLPRTPEWHPVFNHFVTSHATASPIDLFNSDEGNQQEQLAIWLTDTLHPFGVHHSPQIPKESGTRELTDVLLSYEFGSVLIESKALAIFGRNTLPNRAKLARDVSSHIKKAVNQLRGGIRRLKDGTPVTSKAGVPLNVERTLPIHGIILIPDLTLIEDRETYGLSLIRDFMKATGGFLHLLDIAELLRVVQAAEMIAARSENATPMMAFDYYLLERVEKAREAGTLCIEVLLRFADE